MATILPKTFMHKKVKYYLIDTQYSLSNAKLSSHLYGQIYGDKIQDAKHIIRHDTLNGKDIYGIYCTRKTTIRRN